MKKILLLLFCFTSVATGFTQTGYPATTYQYIPYQGVARNATGQPLANTTLYTFTVITNYDAVNLYAEYRTVTTNQFGLFTMQVGSAGATPDPRNTIVFDDLRWDKMISPEMLINIRLGTTGSYTRIATVSLASVPFAQMASRAKPWKYGTAANPSISPDLSTWKLGLGTDTATEKLHVVGKLRLVDGNQGASKVLTSDANGVATWQPSTIAPSYFTLDQNNVGVGINTLSITDTTRGLAIGTRTSIPGGPGLSVNGPLLFTGNGAVGSVNLIRNGDVLTTDGTGNARWRSLEENPFGSPWVSGPSGSATIPFDVIKPKQTNTNPVLVNSRLIVQRSNPLIGDGSVRSNYPLAVSGSQNGLAISINRTSPNSSNKFIGFFNDQAEMRGRIEGQTQPELQEDPQYIAYILLQTLSTGAFVAEGIACGFQADFFEVAVQIAQAGIWGADLADQVHNLETNVGVAYVSGNADYAEWLERANHAEKFAFGDIVSVRGGKISKNLFDGGQLMVISKAPVVLGNMPEAGKEAYYEKVAFMGQVPVKVQGTVTVGDYIVAKPDNIGVGYAVKPDNITTEEYSRIVGVAWEASKGNGISIVNTAVGVNTHTANSIMKKQEEKITLLENQFNQLSAYLQAKDPAYQYTKLETKSVTTAAVTTVKPLAATTVSVNPIAALPNAIKPFVSMSALDQMRFADNKTKEKVRKLITEKPEYLDAVVKVMKEKMEANSANQEANPQVKRMLSDRAFLIETIKKVYSL